MNIIERTDLSCITSNKKGIFGTGAVADAGEDGDRRAGDRVHEPTNSAVRNAGRRESRGVWATLGEFVATRNEVDLIHGDCWRS